ncbi:type II secretion system protein GspC [Halopseudomonas formosensis]|uniref:General secretion pathway protein C n=1 Tax=Halopseudomonas formosensis TaxID=1002526 RepID=A0A1I6B6J7_9GAMM|nr:type II secretion system protein GspC [Halopseudomonas formosensis]MDX9688236.1 type II secretion system protein GspC [Halopseudomonas formosensis]MDY3197638.1 type II secretion system protein GspC [Pseudomonadaceae bacterium]SFQ76534.1 general secretion pathway protein C [Halopseudomonas formosensis]
MPVIARLSLDSVVKLATFLLVAITSVLLARLTWTLIEPTSVLPPAASVPLAELQADSATGARGGFRELAALSVFGTPARENRVVNAPETSLSWTLKGVFTNPDPSRSAAILAPQGQPEKLYRVGASLPGSVTLQEVFADRVILDRGGRLETLRLKRHDAPASAGRRSAPALPAAAQAEPRVDRDAWVNDPQRFLDVISANPVMEDGVLYGLEVSPARNAREFEAAGLVSGDVITEVNGRPVAEISDYRDLLAELADASSVSVSLERNGEPMNITINMD